MKCAPCSEKKCTKGKDCTDIKAKVKAKYVGEDLKILMTADTLTENFYMQKTRMEEILYFAKEMGYKKLGLAFCSGLKEEAEIIDRVSKRLNDNGMDYGLARKNLLECEIEFIDRLDNILKKTVLI